MKMINSISQCNKNRTDEAYCSLTPTCKGWGCKFLTTVIEEVPETEEEKAKLFAKVYREAKHKGVIDCPAYRSIFIDEVLENIGQK
ncbi:hypothetical protein [uncultured Bacteroides sp.]|uniref:hypothetical protein n=1 Tax=uncultured Bacteroides sp. TaxID=162156 RepID=UPI003747AE65